MAGKKDIKPVPSLEPFASPDQLDLELQSFLEEACSRLCKWFANAGQTGPLPSSGVMPEVTPSVMGGKKESLLADLQLVMDGAYQPSHPGSLAHLDPPPLTASIVADLICAGLNNNLLAEELSPSLSRLERLLIQWFVERLGLPLQSGGVAASGGSLSNLMALVVARNVAGLQNDPTAVVLASQDCHVSFAKAVRVMGLNADALIKVNTNPQGQLAIESLKYQLQRLKLEGKKCLAVVATAGTTVRGVIDPLEEIGNFCLSQGLWFHVDGAIGGVFALSEKTSYLLKGISKANSITLNPQKLLGIAKTSSLLLVANQSNLISTFSTGLPYVQTTWGEDVHGGEMGIQGTRPAEVLKLWLGLRQLGQNGIERLLVESICRRDYLESRLDSSKLEIISGPLHLISFTPKQSDKKQSEQWALATRKVLLEENFMLSTPLLNGRYYLKAVMGNPHTKFQHLDKLADLLNKSL